MAITGKIGFHVGTYAEYSAKKAAGTLVAQDFYFTSDTKEMFIGAEKYCEAYKIVADFPAESPVQGVIYINETTYEAKVWDGSAWQVVSPAIVTDVATGADDAVPTVKAVKDYIASEIGGAAFISEIEDTATVDLDVTEEKLTANVKVSAEAGNLLEAKADGLFAKAPADATNAEAGIIRIATDDEAAAGTLENVAVNPKQLLAAKTSATAFKGAFDASAGNYDAIATGARLGDVWAVSVAGTVDGVEYNVGDLLYVTAVDTLEVVKIDNTESADIVRLDQAQTLTNKTIDAAQNTISNIAVTNLSADAVATSISDSAVDTKLATEKAVADAIAANTQATTLTAGAAIEIENNEVNALVDDATVEVNAENKLALKDGAVTTAKIANDALVTALDDTATDTQLVTAKAAKDYADNAIAEAALEWQAI